METALDFRNDISIGSATFKGFGEVIDQSRNIIKVIGVGGGGSNAVKKMVKEGLKNVSFAVINTDSQALQSATVPTKIQIGTSGLGVGGVPEKGREAAEESIEDIKHLFEDNTKMVFIAAGMGGGTGTGASPVIARVAREKGILTVGVVTLPFKFEKDQRINKALKGVATLKEEVDSLIVINNERLIEIYKNQDTTINEAMELSDKVVTTATRSIAEIITIEGTVNRDFCDVKTVLQNGGATIMSSGRANGEHRVVKAVCQALQSPMLNQSDIHKSKKLLYIIYQSHSKEVLTNEVTEIQTFMDNMAPDLEVLWGLYYDDSLGDDVRVDIVATGFDRTIKKNDEILQKQVAIDKLRSFYYSDKISEKTSDLVTKLVTDITPAEEEPETVENTENEENIVGFANDTEDNINNLDSVNTDSSSSFIISFDDDNTAVKAKEEPVSVPKTTIDTSDHHAIQTSIDFGEEEQMPTNNADEIISKEDVEEDIEEDVEEDDMIEKDISSFGSSFNYYLNKFKTSLDKLVNEN